MSEKYDLVAEDQAPLKLTRVPGGKKGPVLLVHGVGVSSDMFALPTIGPNFVEYLEREGYDIWLLDWRASIIHPLRQFTLDEAAVIDMPAAVRHVREVTGAETVQAVVHCAGALAFFMSMGAGLLPDVTSVVASQVALHVNAPPASVLKARARLASTMARLGVESMSPADDDGYRVLQTGLGLMTDAVHHECRSTFCHRLTFIYGHLYRHGQLNEATHASLDEHFGRCSIRALQHLSQMVLAGHAAKYDYGPSGNERAYGQRTPPDYLDPGNFKIPIRFISGALNRVWLPLSTERTYSWLLDANGSGLYSRYVVDGYGHLDTFMGANAARSTYPLMLQHLEQSNQFAPS
jgi:pimeloyl-ACP methyl ester carboxylesterase